ncbi:MAG: FAD-dependent monooxygenase [Algicola sp.]|nr:FAD-dependent monooxygenase [Algicola sp.]
MKPQHITVIGAGPVGSLTAIYLAQRGYQVSVFEKRPDMRNSNISAGRSINLALANRGIHPLNEVGLMDKIEKMLIPMNGRMVHDIQGNTNFQAYGQREHEVIYSISRGELNKLLMNEAQATGSVDIHFCEAVTDIDFEQKTVSFTNENSGETTTHPFELLIGADGSGSIVRKAIHQQLGSKEHSEDGPFNRFDQLGHSYKELCIPAGKDKNFLIEKKALHIWPRGEYMLIALPNLDGSFTVTLFLPNEGENSFAELTTEESVTAFFKEQFADALAVIPTLAEDFFANPTGHLATVRCDPWHHANNTLLIGDAAHGIVPFHGQGMNCGFEDAGVLNQILDKFADNEHDNWENVFAEYAAERQPNGNAIADLALDNYIEMRSSVADPKYLLKKELAFELEKRHPDHFIPRYSMVMFHLLPYADAQRRGVIQNEILNELTANATEVAEVDMDLADKLIGERLM